MSGRLAVAEPIVAYGQPPPKQPVFAGARNADGLIQENAEDQTRIAAYARKPYYNNGHGFPHSGWCYVNSIDVKDAEDMYRNNSQIRLPVDINLNALLGGGIQFGREGKHSGELKEWSSAVWLTFISDALKALWMYGFVVWTWVPQPGAGAIPCVVPLQKLEVMFKLNILGEPMWAIREMDSIPSLFGNTQQTAPPLNNFYVYTWHAPSAIGNLNSEVLSLRPTFQYLEQLKRCAVIAEIGKCRPAVITEEVETKQDVKLSGVFSETDLQDNFTDEALTHYAARRTQFANTMPRDEFLNLTHEIRYMFESQFGDHLGPRLDLPKHRKLARYPLPQAPGQIRELILLAQQNALMIFGIPPAMIQAESSKGKINLDMNAQAMYAHHMRNLKQKVLAMVHGVYSIIYGGQHVADYLLKIPLTESADLTKAREAAHVTITMPGIPPESILKELYLEGTLKYEAYRQYMSANYSIPIEHLEATPKLSIKDLLTGGKAEKTTAAAAAAAKKPSKAKAKTKAKAKKATSSPKPKRTRTKTS
jgi:hypothetical protein